MEAQEIVNKIIGNERYRKLLDNHEYAKLYAEVCKPGRTPGEDDYVGTAYRS